MKRELKVRLALAGFLKDTLTEITNKKVRFGIFLCHVVMCMCVFRIRLYLHPHSLHPAPRPRTTQVKGKESPNAALLNEFVEKARAGTHIGTTEIQRFARLFKVCERTGRERELDDSGWDVVGRTDDDGLQCIHTTTTLTNQPMTPTIDTTLHSRTS